MAIIPTFEKTFEGSDVVTSELWVDLGAIPVGTQCWFGFAVFIAIDKSLAFHLRTNKAGLSAGDLASTTLHDYGAAVAGDSVDRDLHRDGNTFIASIVSSGVEHVWLRVTSKSGSAGDFDFIVWYTDY